jgi:hypothetical protein
LWTAWRSRQQRRRSPVRSRCGVRLVSVAAPHPAPPPSLLPLNRGAPVPFALCVLPRVHAGQGPARNNTRTCEPSARSAVGGTATTSRFTCSSCARAVMEEMARPEVPILARMLRVKLEWTVQLHAPVVRKGGGTGRQSTLVRLGARRTQG